MDPSLSGQNTPPPSHLTQRKSHSVSPRLTQTSVFYHSLLCSLCSSHPGLLCSSSNMPRTPFSPWGLCTCTLCLECPYHRLLHGLLLQVMQVSPHMAPPQRSLSQSLFIKTNKYQKIPSHPPPPPSFPVFLECKLHEGRYPQ